MSDNDTFNPVPILIVLSLPIIACLAIVFFDDGIERALFNSAVFYAVLLGALGAILSFIASRLSPESEG